jgi:hypothetical protein
MRCQLRAPLVNGTAHFAPRLPDSAASHCLEGIAAIGLELFLVFETVWDPWRRFEPLGLDWLSIDRAVAKRTRVDAPERITYLPQDVRTELGLGEAAIDILTRNARIATVAHGFLALFAAVRGRAVDARHQARFHLDEPLFMSCVIH